MMNTNYVLASPCMFLSSKGRAITWHIYCEQFRFYIVIDMSEVTFKPRHGGALLCFKRSKWSRKWCWKCNEILNDFALFSGSSNVSNFQVHIIIISASITKEIKSYTIEIATIIVSVKSPLETIFMASDLLPTQPSCNRKPPCNQKPCKNSPHSVNDLSRELKPTLDRWNTTNRVVLYKTSEHLFYFITGFLQIILFDLYFMSYIIPIFLAKSVPTNPDKRHIC